MLFVFDLPINTYVTMTISLNQEIMINNVLNHVVRLKSSVDHERLGYLINRTAKCSIEIL